ncbi:hypothetical protein FB381_3878 [Nocardioides albertanoniae]|uniref:Fibronectin type-III domain-containing protein n=1 Tax=Nocardioides albertanoniae TaxID=1175486 RepID=A0A543ABI7_9ACTN|nr:hypothetical protein [Nocardioides albertanoniae]TQL69955.1 hypothetical protein FB381_3878 [Nocardioides albertanoniae]
MTRIQGKAVRARWRLLTAGAAAAVLGVSGLAMSGGATADTAPSDPELPETVSADVLPTVQIDGVAWKQVIVGDTVYVGGNFSSARPAGAAAGTDETPRSNLLAYRLSTGELITGFAPSFNGQVKDMALSPDKTLLYLAGSFTQVNGVNRYRGAAINLATGALTSFRPIFNSATNAVAATADAVFYGGAFTSADNTARTKVAAVRPSDTGTQLLPMNPTVSNGSLQDLVVSPDGTELVIAGNFTRVNGSSNPGYGLARIKVSTGASVALPVNSEVRNGGSEAAILSLESDGTSFYGSGYHYGSGGNVEGSFKASWATGQLTWLEDCHGDTYSVWPTADVVYQASHKHYCGNSGGFPETKPRSFQHSTAVTQDVRGTNTRDIYGYPDHPGTPRPEFLEWYPKWTPGTFTGSNQAPWTVSANADYVVYGGEFVKVNGVAQQGLVRFAVHTIAPNDVGPALRGAEFALTATSPADGQARLTWPGNADMDNATVTYKVYRGSSDVAPIHTQAVTAAFWKQTTQSFLDTEAPPGSTQRYRVVAEDAFGNTSPSEWVTVEIDGEPAPPEEGTIAEDAFERAEASGWGSADAGGAWTRSSGTASSFSVADGRGRHAVTPGGTAESRLADASGRDVDATVSVGVSRLPDAGYVWSILGARVSGSTHYASRLRFNPDGTVGLHLVRSGTPVVGANAVPGLSVAAGDRLMVRLQVTGTAPATVRTKVWPAGSSEPSAWTYELSDSTLANQIAGGVMLRSYGSSTIGATPVEVGYDDLSVVEP